MSMGSVQSAQQSIAVLPCNTSARGSQTALTQLPLPMPSGARSIRPSRRNLSKSLSATDCDAEMRGVQEGLWLSHAGRAVYSGKCNEGGGEVVAANLGLLGATHRCCATPWGMWDALVYGIAADIQTKAFGIPRCGATA